MAEEWVRTNLEIDDEYDAINWGDGVYTNVDMFIEMFGEIIQKALNNGESVKQSIIDNDNGRGFTKYFQ